MNRGLSPGTQIVILRQEKHTLHVEFGPQTMDPIIDCRDYHPYEGMNTLSM